MLKKLLTLFLIFCFVALAPQAFAAGPVKIVAPTLMSLITYAPTGLNSGLVDYWTLDDGTGTSAKDSSGSGNNGTLTSGPTWTAGRIGQGVNFDGVDDAITIPAGAIDNLSAGTISAWVYLNSNSIGTITAKQHDGVGTYGIFSIGYSVGSGGGFITGTAGKLYWHGKNGAGTSAASSANLTTGQWYHVVVTFNTSGASFYINGSLDSTVTGADYSVPSDGSPTLTALGYWNTSVALKVLSGTLDDVRVYNHVLSAQEVSNLYSSSASGYVKAYNVYYPFDVTSLVGSIIKSPDLSSWNASSTLFAGATLAPGKFGNGLSLNGTSAYASASSSPSSDLGTATSSVSAWVYLTAANASSTIASKRTAAGAVNYMYFIDSDQKMKAYSTNGIVSSSGTVSLNAWHDLVWTYDNANSGTVNFYVDGVSSGSGTLQMGASNTGDLFVGNDGASSPHFLKGVIDELKIYPNKKISQSEVTNLYGEGKSKVTSSTAFSAGSSIASGLLGLWTFDGADILNGTLKDRSGNGKDGSFINIASSTFYAPGKLGQAGNFDGIDDYMNLGNVSSSLKTLSFWIGMSATTTKILDLNGTASVELVGRTITANNFVSPTIYVNGVATSTLQLGSAASTVTATGGTITYNGSYTIHTFTTSGTFTPNGTLNVEYLVVAGGGGGGSGGGGGGAGGMLTGSTAVSTAQTVTIGGGGNAGVGSGFGTGTGSNGNNSVFGSVTATGGGGGGGRANGGQGSNGGSGGGGGIGDNTNAGGSASPSGQGNNGGRNNPATGTGSAGGGGGAGAAGQNGQGSNYNNAVGGAGGTGIASSISGASVTYAGGGGGSVCAPSCSGVTTALGGAGGAGGGGAGADGSSNSNVGTSGTANTGGGGGGGVAENGTAGNGGSGIVIVRYLTNSASTAGWQHVAITTGTAINASAVNIGRISSNYFTGKLDDIRFYNKVLSAAEVKQLTGLAVAKVTTGAAAMPSLNSSGLVGYWTFDGPDMVGGVAKDRSGQGNDGTLKNIATSTFYAFGKLGQAANFDGVDDYVSVGSATLAPDAGFTASYWFRPAAISGYMIALRLKGTSNEFLVGSGKVSNSNFAGVATYFGFRGSTAMSESTAGHYLDAMQNQWHHFVVVYNGGSKSSTSSWTLYFDGVSTSLSTNGGIGGSGNLNEFGRDTSAGYLSGKLDDVRVYNRALSATEVSQLYNLRR